MVGRKSNRQNVFIYILAVCFIGGGINGIEFDSIIYQT